ncbi:MAG: TonB-dependent receptor [Opitutales bacterium]|nr:TonB-dependent receptor [Opitutales bacterium]
MRRLLAAFPAVLCSTALAPLLQAQDYAGSDEDIYVLDNFVVTSSFSGSLADAAEKKQNAPLIVEVISAEDIGKLPDTSIAESLARLPGITTQRINGRAQIVSIRGLNEDFSSATLNGREQVTTGSVRAIEFDQYPAELMSGAVVYKTGDASVVTQGIAGVVDLRTVRPLSYGKSITNVGVAYEWTEFDALVGGSDRGGMRFNMSYIDQLLDGKLGIAIGYAYNDKMGQGKQWNSWGYADYTDAATDETNAVIGGAKPFVRSSELERHGLMATIEYKVSDNIRTTIDLGYTKFKEDQRLVGIEFPLAVWGDAVLDEYSVTDGVITSGTFSNVRGVMRNDIVERDADIYNIGWNLDITDVAGWNLNFDLSYSMIDRTDLVLETYSGTSASGTAARDTLVFSMSEEGAVFTPGIDYSDSSLIVLTSPAGWGSDVVPGGQLGYLKTPESKDELYQAKFFAKKDVAYFWDTFKSIEFGANYTTRSKYEYEKGYYLAAASGATEVAIPVSTSVTDLSFIGIPGMVTYDPVEVLNSGVYERIQNPNSDVLSNDWDVDEDVFTVYSKMGISTHMGEVPVDGALGYQFVYTDQSSSGTAATGSGADGSLVREAIEGGDDYWDFVPSFSLNFNVAEGRYIRFSAARQMARQRMDYMRAGTQFGYDQTKATSTDLTESPWSGSGGNPELKPWRANALDLSFEQYFKDNMGYFSLSGFYKDLLSYTYQENTLTDFTAFADAVTGTEDPLLWEGYVSRWTNGDGGDIYGVEATLSLPGELLSDYLKGFGVILSGSYTESNVSYNDGDDTPLPGLSDKVFNSTVYYERGGFSARMSATYRSEYLATVSTFGPRSRTFRTADAETVIDAQIGYSFNTGMLEGTNIFFQAYNITNEPLSTYVDGDSLRVIDYQEYGRSYAVGVSYKF